MEQLFGFWFHMHLAMEFISTILSIGDVGVKAIQIVRVVLELDLISINCWCNLSVNQPSIIGVLGIVQVMWELYPISFTPLFIYFSYCSRSSCCIFMRLNTYKSGACSAGRFLQPLLVLYFIFLGNLLLPFIFLVGLIGIS